MTILHATLKRNRRRKSVIVKANTTDDRPTKTSTISIGKVRGSHVTCWRRHLVRVPTDRHGHGQTCETPGGVSQGRPRQGWQWLSHGHALKGLLLNRLAEVGGLGLGVVHMEQLPGLADRGMAMATIMALTGRVTPQALLPSRPASQWIAWGRGMARSWSDGPAGWCGGRVGISSGCVVVWHGMARQQASQARATYFWSYW